MFCLYFYSHVAMVASQLLRSNNFCQANAGTQATLRKQTLISCSSSRCLQFFVRASIVSLVYLASRLAMVGSRVTCLHGLWLRSNNFCQTNARTIRFVTRQSYLPTSRVREQNRESFDFTLLAKKFVIESTPRKETLDSILSAYIYILQSQIAFIWHRRFVDPAFRFAVNVNLTSAAVLNLIT